MLIPPPVHNHLLALTDVKCEVISLTPSDQFQHFLPVSSLIIAFVVSSANFMMTFGLGSDTVKREQCQYEAE